MQSDAPRPFQFGDVVLVRFPFTNRTVFKQRPVVVISNSDLNHARPDVVTMAITSRLDSVLGEEDVRIADWQAAGLLKPSAVKPLFATIERTMIARPLGAMTPPDIARLREAIATMIG